MKTFVATSKISKNLFGKENIKNILWFEQKKDPTVSAKLMEINIFDEKEIFLNILKNRNYFAVFIKIEFCASMVMVLSDNACIRGPLQYGLKYSTPAHIPRLCN